MFQKKVLHVLFGCAVVFSYPGAGLASDATVEDHTYLVGFEDEIDVNVIENSGGETGDIWDRIDAAEVEMTSSEAAWLSSQEDVEYVELNQTVEVSATPPLENWGLEHLDIPDAWDTGVTGEGIDVAVVDTGIESSHPSLNVTDGFSAVPGVTSYDDDNGHGTHAAGIIAANQPSAGLVGVAPDVNLYAVKVLDAVGRAPLSQVLSGIDWAIDQDVDVISMSFGTLTDSTTMQSMLDEAYEDGIIIAAAAGNRGEGTLPDGRVEYPARYDSTVAVGAVDTRNERAYFSATGEAIEIVAPGVNVVSTYKDSTYGALSGTSMAAPFVAGAFALLKEAYPEATAQELRSLLQDEAIDLGEPGRDPSYGYGLVQLPDLSEELEPNEDNDHPLDRDEESTEDPVEEEIEDNPIDEDPIETPDESTHIPAGVDARVVYENDSAAVHVFWNAPDQDDVTAHRIYRDGVLHQEVEHTTLFEDENVDPGTYEYKVTAIDADGNESEKSPPVEVVVEEETEDDESADDDSGNEDTEGEEEPDTGEEAPDQEAEDTDNGDAGSEDGQEEEDADRDSDEEDSSFSWPDELDDAPTFEDVDGDYWAAEPIQELSSRGIIQGSDGTFRPSESVRRGQALAMIGRMLEWQAEPVDTEFPDVDSDYFSSGYIHHAVEADYISGFSDGTFRPNNNVTRGQMAAILGSVFELDVSSVSATDRFIDVEESTTGYRAIAYLAEEGIVGGYDDGTYRPNEPLTRAQFASIFYELGEHLIDEDE
ncbi:S8 family peptidase [Alteribacillus iranensis]|uniref:S-layer homology domain-containing protein n=1 Tax=Alteribacillus iranensis TaxID=930128 RepID=A0A1I2BW83_9BACI|nr:S8 family serine peptidase [Alteribacillus iranensis]SFE60337.1 S-layer homology domain-containing protein [Alteribacillus iranensis]